MEKSRMHIINGVQAEEPITTDGFFCSFQEFRVKCVYLDNMMRSPDG